MEIIEARVARTLQQYCANYQDLTHDPRKLHAFLREDSLPPNEHAIGLYENHPGSLTEAILITNQGLRIQTPTGPLFIAYQDILSTEGPPTKEEISGITLHLRNGQRIDLPIRGAQGRFRDAFMFLTFLHGIPPPVGGAAGDVSGGAAE